MAGTLFEQAAQIIQERKRKREEELDARRAEVYAKAPQIKEIEAKLDSYGMRMLEKLASGESSEMQAVAEIMQQNKEYHALMQKLLEDNGFCTDYLEVAYYCDKCRDSGYLGGNLCSCMKAALTSCALAQANLSDKMADQTFDKFDLSYYSEQYSTEYGCSPRENMRSILQECRTFAKDFPQNDKNLVFCGGCGLGKTYLSSAVANELIDRGTDVLYVSSNALFPILEDMHFGRNVSERQSYIINKINDCELLILDDLGSEFITQFTCAELFRIVNNRMLGGLPMIISTNLNRTGLAQSYGERIASRITGGFDILEFFGEDIRKIKKYEKATM